MTKRKNRKKTKFGLAPGTPVFTGEQKMDHVKITCIHYSEEHYEEKQLYSAHEIMTAVQSFQGKTWINIDGLHDEKNIEDICTNLAIHKLTMEDILNIGQRPKIDEYAGYIHIALWMLMLNPETKMGEHEQLSFILRNKLLISFQEKTGDIFNSVRKRLKEGKGMVRKRNSDYLLYALIDSVVDHYFVILEQYGDHIDELENSILDVTDTSIIRQLHLFRRELIKIRRSIYPLREVVYHFEKIEEPMVSNDTKVFIRDLYDHTIQVIDTLEVFRETLTGLLDLYMNTLTNKTNEIMKVLTMMASIFIPLTFIAGIYGMNFSHMPELHYKYGYFTALGGMMIVFMSIIIYFKKKKWL